jgi:hypothetical protein
MGRHIVIPFVVVQVPTTMSVWATRSGSVLRHHRVHPCGQILEHPRISILINGEAATGVQAREVHHSNVQSGLEHQLIQLVVERGETWSVSVDLQFIQHLSQRHPTGSSAASLARS